MEAAMAPEDRPSIIRIYLTVIGASVLHVSTGAVTMWSSPILPKLNLTPHEQGLVTSLYSIGAAPGPFITSFCLDTIGRKGTLFIIWLCFLVSWVILSMSQNVYVIYAARIIGGVGVGGATTAIPIYVAEVAITEIRGRLGASSMLMVGMGGLIMFGVGPMVSYETNAIYGVSMVAIFALIFCFIPESPFYHLKKGRKTDAEEALQKLRGYRTRKMLQEELAEIEKAVSKNEENAVSFLEGMKHPAAFKAIGIGIFLPAMMFFSGVTVQGAYAETIYGSIGLSFPPSYIGIINIILAITFSFLPILFVNKLVGIKTAMVISGFGCSLTCAMLGVYFFLINAGDDLYDYSYLAIVLSVANNFTYCLGVGSLVWPMIAEILPLSIKGIGSGICGCFSSLIGFGVLEIFPIISDLFGYSTAFFGFSIIMLILSAIAIYILPDTTGKTLQEIEELLTKKK